MGFPWTLWHAVGLLVVVTSATSGQAVEWILRPQSVSVREGENVTFECRLNIEDPNLIWSKDSSGSGNTSILFVKSERFDASSRVSTINRYDLFITNVKKEDNGVYACRTKDAGIQTASLTVLLPPGPPSITRDDMGPIYSEGKVVKFTCSSAGGNPDPNIVWLKNGNFTSDIPEVKASTVLGGRSSSTISVKLDKSDHQANYSCLVYNELNVNSKLMDFVVLNVKYSPNIAFRPYQPTYLVRMGSNVTFYCDVDANPSVSYVTWSKDGVALSGTSLERSLKPVSKTDSGIYKCTAKNAIGERSATLDINVQYSPIISIPATVTANEGESVNVNCSVDANPIPFEVIFSKVLLDGTQQPKAPSPTLKIDVVNRTDAGNYSCRARSQLRISGESVDPAISEAFTYIYVQYKPGRASIGTVPDVDVGDKLEITCTATPNGYPEPTYTWKKDGQTLSQNRQTLTIVSVKLSDNGRYSCTPINNRGSGETAFVNVSVFEPPLITKKPELELSVFLSESKMLTLTCEARGYPQPQVTWYQEGENQSLNMRPDLFTVATTTKPVDSYSVLVQSVLQFKGSARSLSSFGGQRTALQIRDIGNYSCQAESDKHTDTPITRTQLLINFPPVLEATSKIQAASKQEKAELVCTAQGYPEPTLLWYFQGLELSNGKSGISITQNPLGGVGKIESRLTFLNVTDRNYGSYRCYVRNGLGNTSQDIVLAKKSPPEQPSNLTAPSTTWESVILVWIPGFDGGYNQRFHIQKSGGGEEPKRLEVAPSSSRSFNVTKLRPSNTYTFQVVAANELGFGPVSLPVVVTTNNLMIPTLPKIPVFDAKYKKLLVISPYDNDYCLRVEVKAEKGDWSAINGCMKVMGDTLEISHNGVTAVNVSVCLSQRTDVCGVPVAAEINSNNEAQLTEQHVIIIACVCGFIIVTLLIILFCFIYRRRRNAAKTYQGGNQGDPPPYNAVPPNKKPQVYDNQGMDTSDLQLTPAQQRPTAPPPSPPPVHANSNSFTNNSYGPLDLNFTPGSSYYNSQPGSPHSRSRGPKEVNIERRPINGPPIEKKLFENEINHRRDNNRMDGYPITAHKDSPTSIPTKDKYIDLHDRGGGGDPMMGIEGYNEPSPGVGAGGKQKKSAKIKWRWQWKKKEAPPQAPQFAHNPPGHTCGLPCCNHEHDNIATNPTAPPQRGCVPVPLLAAPDFSNSNFFMKRKAGIESGLKRTPDNVVETVGDGWEPRSYYNDKQGRTVLSLGKSPGVKSNAKKISKKGEDHLATSLRQRKKLAPWEHIRQRQITLPDTSSTYKMMFLNFQPGESSDFPEATPLHLTTPRRELTGYASALPSAEAIVNNKMYTLDGQEDVDLNLSPSFEHREGIAHLSTSDKEVHYGEASHRRLMDSELPPLPPDDDPSPQNDANNNTANNVASASKDAASLGDTSSLLEDHVYDVPNELLDQMEGLPKSSSWPQAASVSDVAMTTSSISDLYISDIDSVNYHGSGSDSNTESYVYNGSLLSQDVDGNESTAGYPVVFNNQPRPFDKSHYWPAAWRRLKNEKTVYLKNKPMHGFSQTYLESDTGDTSSVNSSLRGGGGFTRGKHRFNPSAENHLEDMGYLNLALTGASKNRTLPLKLWDLKLSSRNREQNLYSTFPLRRPILEDLTVGQFVRLPEYGYRHRHHSDVSTDHYVTRKIERILRAPVTRSSRGGDSPTASSVWVDPYKTMTDSDKDDEDAAPSWRKLFRYNRQAVWENHFDSSNTKYELFPDWPKFENEDSEDEPITLSGIYNWGRESRVRTVDVTAGSPAGHAQEEGDKIEPDHLPSSGTNMYSGSNGGEFGDGPTARGGIMDSRHPHAGPHHPHAGPHQTAPSYDVETALVTRTMVWADAGIVDWRRQAEQFKDKHFITLIL